MRRNGNESLRNTQAEHRTIDLFASGCLLNVELDGLAAGGIAAHPDAMPSRLGHAFHLAVMESERIGG